jgi:hypothetical protein
MTSENGMPQSYFNKYGSQGGDPSIVPYNPQATQNPAFKMSGVMGMTLGMNRLGSYG